MVKSEPSWQLFVRILEPKTTTLAAAAFPTKYMSSSSPAAALSGAYRGIIKADYPRVAFLRDRFL